MLLIQKDKLEAKKPDADPTPDEISNLKKDYKRLELKTLEAKELKYQLNTIDKRYNHMKMQINGLESEYNKLKREKTPEILPDLPVREVNVDEKISALKAELSAIEFYSTMKRKTEREISTLNMQINKIKTELNRIPNIDFDRELLCNTQDECKRVQSYIQLRSKYDAYMENKKLRQKYEHVQFELEERIQTEKKSLQSATTFKTLIVEAEAIAMESLISTLNANIQTYLEFFFPAEPLYASIISTKETKTSSKAQIGLFISYKGNSIDISTLSGGERDRVILAFHLGFADYTQSPFILLDECVSSLDQDNADNVFHCIQEMHRDKLTIVVAHQIVTGIFDQVIEL
jgi:DNA repair exonuclease SbcCD ATPase subunit